MSFAEHISNGRGPAGDVRFRFPGVPPAGVRRLVRASAALALATLSACARHETVDDASRQAMSPPPTPAAAPPGAGPGGQGKIETFEATAYSIEGKTASGDHTREGLCAADPDVLPLGTRIRVHDAGSYSGECEIADTGRAVKGQEIDIYMASDREAKQFGRKQVRVEVLSSAK